MSLVNLTSHFKVEYDPYSYKSALEKYETDENTRIQKEQQNPQNDLKEVLNSAAKKPEKFSNKFFTIESDFENKFYNDDSAKFKFGNNQLMEANFIMKNLYHKNTILASDASGI